MKSSGGGAAGLSPTLRMARSFSAAARKRRAAAVAESSAGRCQAAAGATPAHKRAALTSATEVPVRFTSHHRMTVRRRVAPCQEVLELALDVGEQGGGAEPEAVRAEPRVAQLFLHKDEPLERLFRLANPPRRLEPDRVARALVAVPELARPHPPHRERAVHRLLARTLLPE